MNLDAVFYIVAGVVLLLFLLGIGGNRYYNQPPNIPPIIVNYPSGRDSFGSILILFLLLAVIGYFFVIKEDSLLSEPSKRPHKTESSATSKSSAQYRDTLVNVHPKNRPSMSTGEEDVGESLDHPILQEKSDVDVVRHHSSNNEERVNIPPSKPILVVFLRKYKTEVKAWSLEKYYIRRKIRVVEMRRDEYWACIFVTSYDNGEKEVMHWKREPEDLKQHGLRPKVIDLVRWCKTIYREVDSEKCVCEPN